MNKYYKLVRYTKLFTMYFILYVFTIAPLLFYKIWSGIVILPLIEVIIIYYYAIYNPRLAPYSLVFFYGIFVDLAYGNKIGLTSTVLLTVYYIIYSIKQIFYNQTFLIIFLNFFLAITVFASLKYFLIFLAYREYFSYIDIISQAIMTFLLYPVLHYILYILNKQLGL